MSAFVLTKKRDFLTLAKNAIVESNENVSVTISLIIIEPPPYQHKLSLS